MGMRYAARTDANHREIIDALRKVGAQVMDTARLGLGFPDAVVYYRHQVTLLEIKSLSGRATKAQVARLAEGWPLRIVHTVDEALRAVGAAS